MASVIYPLYKQAILTGGSNTDMSSGTVKAVLIDTAGYTYSASHQYLSDVAGGGQISTSAALSSKTFTNGVFDAADTSFPGTTAGTSCEAVIIYIDTGTGSTSRLVAYLDNLSGLPVTTNGQAIAVTWDNGSSKIFAL